MARLTRLALAGHAHLLTLRALGGVPLFVDEDDRATFLQVLREAASQHHVAVYGYALLPQQVYLLATPANAEGLSLLVQALGRRYVIAYNRRHGRRGGLWDGRYRATILQAGAAVLDALLFIDGQAAEDSGWTSAGHHLGARRDPGLADCAEYWRLGNTPFDREIAYRHRLQDGLSTRRSGELAEAAHKGWAIGDGAFLAALAEQAGRPVRPRPRGRPRKAVEASN